ncbi:MAG: Man1-Src1p-C-terminal domain-containing protein [Benniella sp.]|nr:MAG: Man1-Src1p-C-terminal domain-containing protein [Benniella sp.]
MAPPEEPHYLHPDFDPWKIKMDQIRDILIQHHVKTPTGIVKKQQLVDLFNQHIRPQVPQLTQEEKDAIESSNEDKKAKPTSSSKARQSLPSQEESKIEPSLASTRPTRIRRASSKARMASEDSIDEYTEIKPKLKRSNSRTKTSVEKSDTESKAPELARGRKPRKPSKQSDDDDSESVAHHPRLKRENSGKKKKNENFSDENPFQSGSESERKRSRSRSRTRKAKETDKPATRNNVFQPPEPAFSRFMQGSVPDKGDSPKSSKSKPRRISLSDVPPPKPLHVEPAQNDIQDFLKNFRRNLGPFWLILSTVLLAYGIWYRQTRFDIGFCTEAESETPTQKAWFYPSCIPCPDHATCLYSNEEPICASEYNLKPQLLSFGNLLPLTPVCVLNRAKEYRSLQVADAVEKLLHLHAGSVECSFTREKAPKDSPEYKARRGLSSADLRARVVQLKDTNVSDEEFDQYWKRALKELDKRTDKVQFENVQGEEHIRSLKPRRSLGCQFRQALISWIVKFRLILLAIAASIAGGFAVRAHIQKRRKEGRVVNGLVQNVLAKLSDQAHYHYVDPLAYPEPFLPQLHLRDALLADVHSSARRQEIWDKVQAVVERNANVRASSQEVRGELYRVWEWVGPSGVLMGQQHGAGSGARETGGIGGSNTANIHRHQHGDTGNSHLHDHGAMVGRTTRATPKFPPRTGPHGSFFGIRRQDSEYLNPENSLYPSLSQDEYQTRTHQ